jgi:hypothetical protein
MSDNMSVLIKINVNKHGLADGNRSPGMIPSFGLFAGIKLRGDQICVV